MSSKFKIFLLSVAAIILLAVGLIPTIISSSWGNVKILGLVNSQIPGHISAKRISVSWFGPQVVEGFMLKDTSEMPLISFESAEANGSLYSLVKNPLTAGDLAVTKINAEVKSDATGTTNIERALNRSCCKVGNHSTGSLPSVILRDANFSKRNPTPTTPLTMKMTGNTSQGAIKGEFKIDISMDGNTANSIVKSGFDIHKIIHAAEQNKMSIKGDISNFPVLLIDQFISISSPKYSGIGLALFGPQLNLKLQQDKDSSTNTSSLILQLTSPSAPSKGEIRFSQRVVVVELNSIPLNLIDGVLNLNGELTETLGRSANIKLLLDANATVPKGKLQVTSDNLKLSDFNFEYNNGFILTTPATVTWNVDAAWVNRKLGEGPTKLNGSLSASLTLNKLSVPFGNSSAGFASRPSSSDIALNATLSFSPFQINSIPTLGSASISSLDITIENPTKKGLQVTAKTKFEGLNSPLRNKLGPSVDLQTVANINIKSNLEGAYGTLSFNDIPLYRSSSGAISPSSLDNLHVDWDFDLERSAIKLAFNGDARLEGQASGKLRGFFNLIDWSGDSNPNGNAGTIQANLIGKNLPVQFLNILTGRNDMLPLLGNSVNFNVSGFYTPSKQACDLGFTINTPHLTGEASFEMSDGHLTLSPAPGPTEFVITLSPSGYKTLRNIISPELDGDFILTESSVITFTLKDFSLPVSGATQRPLFMDTSFDLDLSIDKLYGTSSGTNQKIFLSNIRSHALTKDVSERISFDVHAKGLTGQGVATSWNLVGVLDNGFNSDGSLNQEQLSVTLDSSVDSFPISLFCQFVCIDNATRNQLEAVIGPTLDAKIRAKLHQLNGSVYLDIKGKNGHFLLDGLVKQGVLTLNQNVTAQINVTPQLSDTLLEGIIPIVDGMVSADQPLTLTIDRAGFALPLNDLNISSTNLANAKLDLGKVRFAPDSEVAKILSLLVGATRDQVVVWITPIYFSLVNGQVNIQRVDLLINDRFPIAAWGDVDIRGNNVNMVIGLTGASISQAFRVPGIPNRFMLQLPLRGTLNHASIDKTKAAARLSALVAQAQGGPQGLVLGTVLHIASGGLTEGAPPEPTTQPLPWGAMLQDNDGDSGIVKDLAGKQVDDTLKQIKKGAGSLLKQILNK